MFYIGADKISPAFFSESAGDTINCLNSTGSAISAGDKVFIAANTNHKLINWASFTSLGFTGIAQENIANGQSGSVATVLFEPVSGLEQWARIDDKATVVGFFTDGNGTKYAVCVADAAYRTSWLSWSTNTVNTNLPDYSTSADAMNATESATWNMEQIVSSYNMNDFKAFNACYPKTLQYNGVIYHGLLPNAYELKMIYDNRQKLDSLDPSLVDYPNNNLTSWNIGNNSLSRAWSSTEYDWEAWSLNSGGNWELRGKNGSGSYMVGDAAIPVFEIPVID